MSYLLSEYGLAHGELQISEYKKHAPFSKLFQRKKTTRSLRS